MPSLTKQETAAFASFLEYADAARLNRNLRNMLLLYLCYCAAGLSFFDDCSVVVGVDWLLLFKSLNNFADRFIEITKSGIKITFTKTSTKRQQSEFAMSNKSHRIGRECKTKYIISTFFSALINSLLIEFEYASISSLLIRTTVNRIIQLHLVNGRQPNCSMKCTCSV